VLRDNGGLNPRGDLVGVYCDTAPCTNASTDDHGFLLRQGEFIPINYPGSKESGAFGINARGDIVGYYVGAGGVTHGFLLSPHY
jgi:probable HAF family extracellular repeat protein